MRTIYLVRHGETDWNKQEIFRGLVDTPLNKTGVEQTKALGAYFAKIPLGGIYASKLSRALDTAKAIAAAQSDEKPIYVDNGLSDINQGAWSGLTLAQAKEKYPELYAQWQSDPQSFCFPNGESLSKAQARARRALDTIVNENNDFAAVTHLVIIRVLLCSLLDLGLLYYWRFEISPASITKLKFENGKWVLCQLNDACHLTKALPD